MGAKRRREQSTPPAAASKKMLRTRSILPAAVSLVLDNHDLLHEILLRLAFPTSLVRAALVCKGWLRVASDPVFLRRFRDLHPPRLLGFYVTATLGRLITSLPTSWFVPMLPQPAEIAAVIRRGIFNFDTYKRLRTVVVDCQNGGVLVNLYRPAPDHKLTRVAHCPLSPAGRVVTLPPPPVGSLEYDWSSVRDILSKENGGRLSYFYFWMEQKDGKAKAHVYMLQGDVWRLHTSATTQHSGSHRMLSNILLAGNRIYMVATGSSILGVDLA